jgi:Arc/MetJ family transcription regulator
MGITSIYLTVGAATASVKRILPYFILNIRLSYDVYTSEDKLMTVTMTSIRLDTDLADEAAKVLGVKSRTEAVHVALREIVALKRFKDLMRKHRGKLSFAGHDE